MHTHPAATASYIFVSAALVMQDDLMAQQSAKSMAVSPRGHSLHNCHHFNMYIPLLMNFDIEQKAPL